MCLLLAAACCCLLLLAAACCCLLLQACELEFELAIAETKLKLRCEMQPNFGCTFSARGVTGFLLNG